MMVSLKEEKEFQKLLKEMTIESLRDEYKESKTFMLLIKEELLRRGEL